MFFRVKYQVGSHSSTLWSSTIFGFTDIRNPASLLYIYINYNMLKQSRNGGLSVGCVRVQNLALLNKWKCRWLQETESLCARVLAAANGGVLGTTRFGREPCRWSVWKDINKAAREVESLGFTFPDLVRREVGMGNRTMFWDDNWIGVGTLKERFRWMYDLDVNSNCLLVDKIRWEEGT